MLTRSLLIVVVLILSSLALAQHKSQQQATAEAPDTTTCAVTYTSGAGHNATSYCVTVNGNIVQFSRGGDEYIRVGDFAEGYGFCDFNSGIPYFDYAISISGNWLASSFSTPTATKAISTRTTSDGIWQIKNTITKVAANAAGPGSAKVSMAIHNLTGVNRDIVLLRYADVDFLRAGVSDFDNDFDFTLDTAMGLAPGFRSGLSLTNNTFVFGYDAFTQNTPIPPNPCTPFNNLSTQPFFGDGSVIQIYGLTVPKLATKTINVTYKPI
jgi:hypothetical protein